MNPNWRILYPEAIVTHLPRVFSDHCPVLIELEGAHSTRLNKPFRFQTMWMMHPKFPKVVEDAWFEENSLPRAVSDFTTRVRKWNNEVFGKLCNRKRRVLARLGGIQKALANNPFDFLLGLEKQFTEEYAMIMLQEVEF